MNPHSEQPLEPATARDVITLSSALGEETAALVRAEGRATTPFGTYLIWGTDPRSRVARSVESVVFQDSFGNTAAQVDEEYGVFDESSLFGCVVDHRRMLPVATLRLITRPTHGLKSFLDVPRLYGVSLDEVIAQHELPIDGDDAWDIATLAVDPSYRQGILSLALFQVICTLARSAGVGALVSIVEVPVIRMIQSKFGSPFERFPGLEPVPYLGSPACVPVWTTGELLAERVSAKDPELWDFLSLGEGLEPAFSAPEWAAFGASLRAAVDHRR